MEEGGGEADLVGIGEVVGCYDYGWHPAAGFAGGVVELGPLEMEVEVGGVEFVGEVCGRGYI